MTTTAKKAAAPRKRAVSGAEAGKAPATTTVITSNGTEEVPVGPVDPATIVSTVEPEVVVEEDGKFSELSPEELRAVADFFVKDYDEGANKVELLAALASGDENDEPVTWEQYQEMYVPTLPSPVADTPDRPAGNPFANATTQTAPDTQVSEVIVVTQDEPDVLVKMERKNPRFDIAGYTFTKEHPFNSVPANTAEFIAQQKGFRLARPAEVTEYYS